MDRSDEFYAHTPPDHDPQSWQTMEDHTTKVAELAAQFAEAFDASALARWCGWLHDVGKYSDDFQTYLRRCHEAKMNHQPPPKAGSAEHKCAGTQFALDLFPSALGKLMAACVFGHHGGLQEDGASENAAALQQQKQNLKAVIERACADLPFLNQTPPTPKTVACLATLPSGQDDARRFLEMLARFVFSCLVDADSLDTEAHFSPKKAERRTYSKLEEVGPKWLKTLKTNQERLQRTAAKKDMERVRHGKEVSEVNTVRREVYHACLKAASEPPGVFTLTVPTGGGKTRSSLAFALAHVAAHANSHEYKRSRIIYAIPYTSIVDQTVNEFRKILGREDILEHHSAIEVRVRDQDGEEAEAQQMEEAREQQRRLAVENWDAPLIVTTTVQLFESLFANRTSRCRKIHNIARSVIILDEVQTLPPRLLKALTDGMRTLVDRFGATVVLCTATQPAIVGDSPYLKGLPDPHPIIADPKPHFDKLRRVTYCPMREEKWDWKRVASEIQDRCVSVLTVLNTKKDALALFEHLRSQNVFHLSTLLCTAHRRHILDKVTKALEAERKNKGKPIYLVTTQVIEAGVDIDFPCVFRAKGPLDRIIQAAGRCNREGGRNRFESEVVVFDPLDGTTPFDKTYKTAIAIAWNKMANRSLDLDDPEVVTAYFASLYRSLGEDELDKERVQAARKDWNFPDVARKVRLIEQDTVPVLVPYYKDMERAGKKEKEAFDDLVEEIRERGRREKGMTRDLWQEAQPRTVAIFRYEVERRTRILEPLISDQIYLWSSETGYDPIVGIGDRVDHAPEDLISPA